MITTIITFIIVFGILVFVHEFGHYYFAKRAGILVREFAIGMGPKLFAYRKNGTTYTWRILPLGGYVSMAGLEDDTEELKKGMPVSLITDENGVVQKINTSKKITLVEGIPLELTDWDLTDGLWVEGYENGTEDEIKRFKVDHDALIIGKDGIELQIAPRDVRFQSASLVDRMLTNFAGPLNNFLLAIVAFGLVAFLQGGVPVTTNTIAQVQTDLVAQKAGLKANDTIIAIDGDKTPTWDDVAQHIRTADDKELVLTVKRADKKQNIKVKPVQKNVNGQKVAQIGIIAKGKMDRSIKAKLTYGFTQTWYVIKQLGNALVSMLHGFSLNDLGGPVAMFSLTSQAKENGLISVVTLTALLSVNLGIINLLPIPALDGGKLLLNIIEAIRRKPLDPEKEIIITMIGFGFLMILMLLVTWNDIQRYFFR
ncbi:RIP metalloprotease RseP [uncultured Ligilactobacillus sp.]|uniref:RIP metalloprotease RseP n=1 Tax=uncultured Ligilactobacillus sp. TaxID=2837633 RepID=UPI00272ACB66|nr:RIP metalloprotease RseP [uncultured Ligilactobacillus sp.]